MCEDIAGGSKLLAGGTFFRKIQRPFRWVPAVSGIPITYGVTRIPSTFGGGLVARRAGRAVSTQGIFYPGSGHRDA